MKQITSQIATTKEQSKILIVLGVLPKTADMQYYQNSQKKWGLYVNQEDDNLLDWTQYREPAWSLSNLIAMLPPDIQLKKHIWHLVVNRDVVTYEWNADAIFEGGSIFDNIIECIKWLIDNEYFNKEYLA